MFVPVPSEYFVKENDISASLGNAFPQNRELLLCDLIARRPFVSDGTGNPFVDGWRENLTWLGLRHLDREQDPVKVIRFQLARSAGVDCFRTLQVKKKWDLKFKLFNRSPTGGDRSPTGGDHPPGQPDQETPKLPYLRQPSGPQSVFYQRCFTRYLKSRRL